MFEFSRARLAEVRTAFARMIRHGEEKLHRVCELLCETFLDSTYTLQSVVIGEVETTQGALHAGEEHLARRPVFADRPRSRHAGSCGGCAITTAARWSRASLVANVVEYQPAGMNEWGIHKFISRIKAEEQIWNKVVDSIFGFDQAGPRRQAAAAPRRVREGRLRRQGGRRRSRRGARAARGAAEAAVAAGACWRSTACRRSIATSRLEFIEVKDYMAQVGRKETGWEAIKSVFRWWDSTIEVQVQPLWNYRGATRRPPSPPATAGTVDRSTSRARARSAAPAGSVVRSAARSASVRPVSATVRSTLSAVHSPSPVNR